MRMVLAVLQCAAALQHKCITFKQIIEVLEVLCIYIWLMMSQTPISPSLQHSPEWLPGHCHAVARVYFAFAWVI